MMAPGSTKAWIKARFNLDRRSSYSQFGEDAVLYSYFWGKQWIANQPTPRRIIQPGFYIDIGAYSPTECSNTFVFYKEGWTGVNVDPAPTTIKNFNAVRPNDRNVCAAIGLAPGQVRMYSWGDPNVFNTTSAELAAERAVQLGREPTVIDVPSMTLTSLLEQYLPAGRQISFMTIDVEGKDEEVLQSNDWDRYRPELVVVEDYSESVEALLASSIHRRMTSFDYDMYAWVRPSVVYRDRRERRP